MDQWLEEIEKRKYVGQQLHWTSVTFISLIDADSDELYTQNFRGDDII